MHLFTAIFVIVLLLVIGVHLVDTGVIVEYAPFYCYFVVVLLFFIGVQLVDTSVHLNHCYHCCYYSCSAK